MGEVAAQILGVLDRCCETFTFPMLDNGYVYLAATRLSLFRSPADWALVIETFGFSPRARNPNTLISTFASRLPDRTPAKFATPVAYDQYIALHPHDEAEAAFPFGEIDWADDDECVAEGVREVVLRGRAVSLPPLGDYGRFGIELEDPGRVRVYELCRYLAEIARDDVLAAPDERRMSVLPEMTQLMQLEEWHHPNVVDDACRPSTTASFRALARVLETGDVRLYEAQEPPNTHWRNWPEGGTL